MLKASSLEQFTAFNVELSSIILINSDVFKLNPNVGINLSVVSVVYLFRYLYIYIYI